MHAVKNSVALDIKDKGFLWVNHKDGVKQLYVKTESRETIKVVVTFGDGSKACYENVFSARLTQDLDLAREHLGLLKKPLL